VGRFSGVSAGAALRELSSPRRETFLAPLSWDGDGWPVIYRDGTVELEMEADCLPPHTWEPAPARDDFDGASLKLDWNFLRNPSAEDWSLTERPGWLRLKGSAVTLDAADSPAFVGRRQQHLACKAGVLMDFAPVQNGEEAGLTVLMNEHHHYEIAVTRQDGERRVFVRQRIGDLAAVVGQQSIAEGTIGLQIEADPERYTFGYTLDWQGFRVLATGATRYLSSEVAGGFTGVYFGMYATGNGRRADAPADFDWFEYQPA
jgi:alpha-N-arabinofuranosidase